MSARRSRLASIVIVVVALVSTACSASVSVDSANSSGEAAEVSTDEFSSTETPPATPGTEDTGADDVVPGVTEVVAAEPTPTVDTVRSPSQQSVSEQYSTIRDVDFFNGFTYDNTNLDLSSGTATVQDGWFENNEFGDDDFYSFGVADIEYGDLNGDGIEEAVLVSTWNGGGSGNFNSVRAFTLVDGEVVAAGIVAFGDRADGGVHNITVIDGTTRVWAFAGGKGACCPDRIVEYTLVLGDHELIEAERGPVQSWMALDSAEQIDEVVFEPHTTSGVLTVYPGPSEGAVRFEAVADQLVSVKIIDGASPIDLSIRNVATGALVPGAIDQVLPADGDYELTVSFADEHDLATMMELRIRDDVAALNVRWSPRVDQFLLDDDPFVRTSVVWPVFRSALPGTEAANETLRIFATNLDDEWIADVSTFEDPQGDSSYDATYEVSAITDEIVSVRFDYFDYVCCRPYPNYGHRAAVVDLAAGRVLPIDEILDVTRIDDITAIWIAQVEIEQGIPGGVINEDQGRVLFDSLALVQGGVEFGTDRNSLAGGLPGTRTVLTFEQLGDLVNPALAARVS